MASSSYLLSKDTITVSTLMSDKTETDGLSNLPDALLIAILSLLKPREMVQTCVLSKKWLKMWASVPCLNFDIDDFTQFLNWVEIEEADLERFENFVNSFLRLRDDATDLHSFRLNYIISHYSESWIRYASRHNLKILQLELVGLGSANCFELKDCMCDALEVFYLMLSYTKLELIVPDNVFLPKLKQAVFSGLNMKGGSMRKFLSGCPALESVELLFCVLNMKYISFQHVKELNLNECRFINELPSFSIFAPQLEYLDYTRREERVVEFKNMSNVKKAFLSTYYLDRGNLSSFSCAEVLSINSMLMLKETLQAELPNCPKFHNLKVLTLGLECFHCAFGVLCSFLKHCPNLEHLILCQIYVHCKGDYFEEAEKFDCDQLRLVTVVITNDNNDLVWHKLMPLLMQATSKLDQVQIISKKI